MARARRTHSPWWVLVFIIFVGGGLGSVIAAALSAHPPRAGGVAGLVPPAERGPGADRRLVAVEVSGTPPNLRLRGDPARLKVTALPREARPRERLRQGGPEALGTTELLALVLGPGTRARGGLPPAGQLPSRVG